MEQKIKGMLLAPLIACLHKQTLGGSMNRNTKQAKVKPAPT